jgi:ACT domain/IrrE N-terminal-like domain
VVGDLPTPLAEVQRTLGVVERISMRNLPAAVEAKKPRAWSRLLGAFWKEERVVFIDEEQGESRRQWTDAHEAVHVMCGWHAEVLRLDNEDTLFKELHDEIEAEANYGAGHLVFQGGRFHRRALADQISIRTPIALSSSYGASGTRRFTTTSRNIRSRSPARDRPLPQCRRDAADLAERRVRAFPQATWSAAAAAARRQALDRGPCRRPVGRDRLQVETRGGSADLEVTGVTAGLAAPLAEIGVPIFVLATFDTDYLLVQASRFDEAIARLRAAGHRIAESPDGASCRRSPGGPLGTGVAVFPIRPAGARHPRDGS